MRRLPSEKNNGMIAKPGPGDFDPAAFVSGKSLRVLLVTANFPVRIGTGARAKWRVTLPPIDIPYLASAARACGHDVSVLAICREGSVRPAVIRKLAGFKPDVVGVSCNINSMDMDFEIAGIVKSAAPRAHVVFGGVQATAGPELCLSNPHVDSVVMGEGEMTLCSLLKALCGRGGLSGVSGLVFKDSRGTVVRNPPRPLIKNLDSIPYPDLDLYPRKFWLSSYEGRPAGPVQSARGCPYKCTFCASSLIFGRVCRAHSPQRTVREMGFLEEKYGIRHFSFYDPNFTLKRERALELCELINARGKGRYTWSCGTRADLVDLKLLKTMKKTGCRTIAYGFESASQRILDRIKKGTTIEHYGKAVRMTREAGIKMGAGFIIGFPTETREETKATIRFALENKPGNASFMCNILVPYMGTDIFEDAMANGYLREGYTVRDLARSSAVWVTNGRTWGELNKWRKAVITKNK